MKAPALHRALAVPAAAVALLASACTGSTDTTETPAGSGTASAIAVAEQTAVTDYLAYTGATAGAADPAKSPITLGWVNAEGGPIQFPEATLGAEAAVKFINAELGGIGGHPLALNKCIITQAEEEGTKCGQQLVNDPAVVGIAYGNVVVGNQALAAVNKGSKPVVAGVDVTPSDATAPNTYILFGSGTSAFGTFGVYARDVLKAKTAALIYQDLPDTNNAVTAVKKSLEGAGLTVKLGPFAATSTDLIQPLTAAGAQTADVVVPVIQPAACVNVAKTIKQLAITTPILASPLCLSPAVRASLGDFPTWTYGIAQTLPSDPTAADATTYLQTAEKYGLPRDEAVKVYGALAWSEILAYAKLMNTIGADKVSAATLTAALKSFTGPVVMGATELSCGKNTAQPALCNDTSRFYSYQGKGAFKAETGWLAPV